MRRPVTIAAALVLLVSGCGSIDAPPAPAPASAPAPSSPPPSTPAPQASATYDSVQRLVGALNAAGIACLNWERTENPTGAVERGSCYFGTEEVVASTYETEEEAAAAPQEKASLLAGISDVNMVVGGNWTLSCDSQQLCGIIEKVFGGKHVIITA